jgi:hypothetical protein
MVGVLIRVNDGLSRWVEGGRGEDGVAARGFEFRDITGHVVGVGVEIFPDGELGGIYVNTCDHDVRVLRGAGHEGEVAGVEEALRRTRETNPRYVSVRTGRERDIQQLEDESGRQT